MDKLSENLTNVTLDKELLKNKLQTIEEKSNGTQKPIELAEVPLIWKSFLFIIWYIFQ